jgi:MerR family mercuric resistance operon transcriptional regulator
MAAQEPVCSIGDLSARTGVHIETIRYYEKIGLLPAPPRSDGGHRLYTTAHRVRLVFLRRSRALGFSIAEIRTLLALLDGGSYTCGDVKAVTVDHLHTIRAKLRDLRELETALVRLTALCDGGGTQACPILDTLFLESG